MKKWVYLFTEGNADMRELLGGKGANLAEMTKLGLPVTFFSCTAQFRTTCPLRLYLLRQTMTKLGLPVPQGFTITTDACTQYYEDGEKINDEIQGILLDNSKVLCIIEETKQNRQPSGKDPETQRK